MYSKYQTVKIKGDDQIHIISNYEAEKGRADCMLCGTATWEFFSGDLKSRDKAIIKVDAPPTCPSCARICLHDLNKNNEIVSASRVIFNAYSAVFGTTASKKGKCNELHKDIFKSSHNFPYIPNNCEDITISINKAFSHITKKRNVEAQYGERRFLDAGCGIGNIVTLASAIGFTAHGIELNRGYLKIARRLTMCMRHKPYFKCADIITFDRYHTYDLIYYYVPIQDRVLQTAFEIHLVRAMKVGAFMLPTGSKRVVEEATSEGYFEKHNFDNSSSRPIFEKIKEVPKGWITKVKWLRKEYREYIGSFKKKSISVISGGNNHVASNKTSKGGKNRKK